MCQTILVEAATTSERLFAGSLFLRKTQKSNFGSLLSKENLRELFEFLMRYLTPIANEIAKTKLQPIKSHPEKPVFEVLLTCSIEVGNLLYQLSEDQLLFESMVMSDLAVRYHIQRVFAQTLLDISRRTQFSSLNKQKFLFKVSQTLVTDWQSQVENFDQCDEIRDQIYMTLIPWTKTSASLFAFPNFIFKLLERFDKVLTQGENEPLECYSISFIVSIMTSRASLSLNLDKTPYDDLCEVHLANQEDEITLYFDFKRK